MPNSFVQKASELTPQARAAVECLLGRSVETDEHISLYANRTHAAPEGPERTSAWRDLDRTLEHYAERAKDLPSEDLEAMIDEVCDDVRHGPR